MECRYCKGEMEETLEQQTGTMSLGAQCLMVQKSIKLRGMLGFQGFQYFLFSLKKYNFLTQVEASLIAINVCSSNFFNLTVQIILHLNEAREKGMSN